MPNDQMTRSNVIAAVAAVAGCLVMMIALINLRGVWLDEAASFLFSRHHGSVIDVARELWISDVHPPLFSAYAWLLAPLLGDRVQDMRLVNLGGLFYAALIWSRAYRLGLDRDFLRLLAVLTISTPFAMLYAAEFRSYFLLLTLGACLIVQLRLIDEGRGGCGWLALTALLLINLHYFGCLIGLILIGCEALRLRTAHRPKAARALLLIAAVAILPLALSLAAMMSEIEPVAVNRISAFRGLLAIGAILGAAALNIAAVIGLRHSSRSEFARLLVGALGTILIVYFLLNLVTQNLLPRHMIAAVPITAALLAISLETAVKVRRWLMPLICANALLLAAGATWYGLSNKRWETNVDRIIAAEEACYPSYLYALNPLSLLPEADRLHSVPHIDDIFATAYLLAANKADMFVMVVPNGPVASPKDVCPALLWVEHLYVRPKISDLELARKAGFTGSIEIERLQRDDVRALLAIRSSSH